MNYCYIGIIQKSAVLQWRLWLPFGISVNLEFGFFYCLIDSELHENVNFSQYCGESYTLLILKYKIHHALVFTASLVANYDSAKNF